MKSTVVTLCAVAVVGLAGWYAYTNYYSAPASVATNTDTTDQTVLPKTDTGTTGAGIDVNTDTSVTVGTPMSATITLTASGFTPESVTVKKGGTVTFINETTGNMWVATAQHPTHTVYAGTTLAEHCNGASDTSFDQCKNGKEYSFAFNKVGSWKYHNHLVAGQFGTVVVVE